MIFGTYSVFYKDFLNIHRYVHLGQNTFDNHRFHFNSSSRKTTSVSLPLNVQSSLFGLPQFRWPLSLLLDFKRTESPLVPDRVRTRSEKHAERRLARCKLHFLRLARHSDRRKSFLRRLYGPRRVRELLNNLPPVVARGDSNEDG